MMGVIPERGLPLGNAIDVWRIDLDAVLGWGWEPGEFLAAEELQRGMRFVRAGDGARFRACRAMLRLGLARYLGKPAGKIALTVGAQGKPGLAEDSPLRFNVSHSGGLALIAFTAVGEVGVDVEQARREVESLEIAERYFTRNETAQIAAAATEAEQASVFLRFWTRKEAAMKAAGWGIMAGLDTIDVASGPIVHMPGEAGGDWWQLRDLDVGEGWLAAVVAPPGDWTIRQWRFGGPDPDCRRSLERLTGQ